MIVKYGILVAYLYKVLFILFYFISFFFLKIQHIIKLNYNLKILQNFYSSAFKIFFVFFIFSKQKVFSLIETIKIANMNSKYLKFSYESKHIIRNYIKIQITYHKLRFLIIHYFYFNLIFGHILIFFDNSRQDNSQKTKYQNHSSSNDLKQTTNIKTIKLKTTQI